MHNLSCVLLAFLQKYSIRIHVMHSEINVLHNNWQVNSQKELNYTLEFA